MRALFVVLNDMNYLDDVLEAFVKLGVGGATIVDSYGMGKALRESPSLSYLMKGPMDRAVPEHVEDSKTLFTVIHDEEVADLLIKTLQNLLNGHSDQPVGFIFSVPTVTIHPIK